MIVLFIKNNKMRTLNLPNNYYGVYWVTDVNAKGEEFNLISISADNGKWKLNSNFDVAILNGNTEVGSTYLENYQMYRIVGKRTNEANFIYCMPTYDQSFEMFYINNKTLTIGNNSACNIFIDKKLSTELVINLSYDDNDNCIITNDVANSLVYVNDDRLIGSRKLELGDRIFIFGVIVVYMKENNNPFIVVNNPNGIVKVDTTKLTIVPKSANDAKIDEKSDDDAVVFSEEDYFHKKPRFKEMSEILNMAVDAPPAKQEQSDMPVILTVGPMLTSSAISIVYAYITINNIVQNGQSILTAWPSLLICILSLMATFGWPFIIRWYSKHRYKKLEKKRKASYDEYIKTVLNTINENAEKQKRILISNNPSYSECQKAIIDKNVNFWNRKPEDEDFLTVSLGIGSQPMKIDLKVPEMHFAMEKDELLENVAKMRYNLPVLNDVPITYNFIEKKVTAIIGKYELNKRLCDNIILQLSALHSYDNIKIVILTNELHNKNHDWEFAKVLPHCWNNDKSIRFYGTNKDEIREICYYLDSTLGNRIEMVNNNKGVSNIPYYVIITDNYKEIRNFDFIKKLNGIDANLGFSLLILNDKVFNLPAECDSFINVSEGTCEIFQNVLNSEIIKFKLDNVASFEIEKYAKMMANIPIEFSDGVEGNLTSKIGFLELYDAGNIDQLNVLNRWNESNPMLTLQSLIGVGKGGEKIYLDLHEKYHGPHGLIAGMTGSGKSEFIATYILSLAVNYHPYEVQFILIDYKGGGLAGVFENKTTGIKLPHLIGTITNLDENEIYRSLASIESEITRRQIIFSQVREQFGDSVIDIYKYQQLYREGVVEEPISHLFIICDEFAELKTQQPEFLQQLISISRIGRSLGIHLILATQKPSGVVDNQIWSNSKFRVCLRVQEKSDSSEVIKCPDAAYLKNTGRFYLQVGYNEVFVLGQAAWAGTNYIPSEKPMKKLDTSVEFINNIGYRIKKVDTNIKINNSVNYGEEAKNIVSYLNDLATSLNIESKNLWLDKMPEYININDLKRKYNFIKEPFVLDVPVGEYDVPSKQQQQLLTVPFYKEGNALVYGATGSGKENFITTMLYSMVTSFNPFEVIAYVIDFGSGSLNVFDGIPHIGDVIGSDDVEKLNNLFKMLFFMLDERKEMFANYNGDYNTFCKNSDKKVPSVVVVLNNYDSFIELYSNFESSLIQLTREGSKYGIYFVITVVNPNNIRLKVTQNIKQVFALQQNNVADYSNILGNVNKKYPSKIFGRGIVRFDDIYEFQTAMVSEPNKIFSYIEDVKPILNTNSVKAMEIPVLPNVVNKSVVAPQLNKDGSVVVGVAKDDLSIVKYDLKNCYTNLFITYDTSLVSHFMIPFIKQAKYTENYDIIVIDAEKMNLDMPGVVYVNQDFDETFTRLYNFIIEKNRIYVSNGNNMPESEKVKRTLCIIAGFDSLINKLSTELRVKVGELFEKGKDLDVVNYIFIDSVDKIRKYEFESWYKTVVNNSRGIFIGNGILDQMVIKLSKSDGSLRAELPLSFCYVINRGRPVLTKYVETFEDEN